ncbi:MAG: hypothetical protein F4Y82_05520 [Cenarchaeum sp. SB0665_bin_23]|nr:hypothetical protein [Cenarchaeum sp. SB0667_bin_13]MXY37997.1 hypothetical protein [Cenarchaeum sp. SB0664_bin_35]MXY61551.1 hypothetical protein [Cenarchaeum sp. SB0665_bin_23]MXZ94066.1 hypothetical protein [Cenarchaeum sp. SB0666_bin_15]MYB46717.1 hypothetical protein [Cenarchaeum sp. SB0662_bin_33]MYC79725.1 hypothetical protein [Cenarchaeum sp. SB0661_bin_35]MYD59141.1 hypothetical protein [Cenarchaeum sp. SB0678_bin_8]MYG32715.1 hypothetical protein [Cenarchaeum sp. SB0677_bin_16]
MLYTTRARDILREIDALKRLRDRKKKSGWKWCMIHDQIYRKANNIAANTINQTVSRITSGVDAVVAEALSIKGMTTHGGNHKRNMNRTMRENCLGEFRRRLAQRCEGEGITLYGVAAKHISQT